MRHTFIFTIISIVLFTGCKVQQEKNSEEQVIITTTGMIADVVKNIVGDSLKVEALMGPGTDPHLYNSSQADLKKLTRAAVIFYNGLHLEGKMAEDLHKLSKRKPVFAVADGVSRQYYRLTDEQGSIDPHIWFNIKIWMEVSTYVYEKLIAIYPEYKVYFGTNYKEYLIKLKALNQWVAAEMASIPKKQRVLITAHDAFGYFGKAYDIEVIGLQGISTVSEASLRKRTELVNLIVDRGIKAVFIESSVDPRYIQAIVEDCKAKGHKTTIGGILYSDAMGAEGTPAGTYIGMVKSNVVTITTALR